MTTQHETIAAARFLAILEKGGLIDRPAAARNAIADATAFVNGYTSWKLQEQKASREFRRTPPLAYIGDRPLYTGDTVYFRAGSKLPVEAKEVDRFGWLTVLDSEFGLHLVKPEQLTWDMPKVRKEGWVNIYPIDYERNSGWYPTEEAAKANAGARLLACCRIEWEE